MMQQSWSACSSANDVERCHLHTWCRCQCHWERTPWSHSQLGSWWRIMRFCSHWCHTFWWSSRSPLMMATAQSAQSLQSAFAPWLVFCIAVAVIFHCSFLRNRNSPISAKRNLLLVQFEQGLSSSGIAHWPREKYQRVVIEQPCNLLDSCLGTITNRWILMAVLTLWTDAPKVKSVWTTAYRLDWFCLLLQTGPCQEWCQCSFRVSMYSVA